MKKIIFCFIVLLAAICNRSSAQFMIGPQAGLNFASLKGSDVSVSSKPGWNAGVFMSIPLIGKQFTIMPAVLYSMRGFKYDYTTTTAPQQGTSSVGDTLSVTVNATTNVNASLGYLDIPILLTFFTQENKGLMFQAGPQISFLISDKSTVDNSVTVDPAGSNPTAGKPTNTNSVSFQKSDISLVGGIGYKFEQLLMLYARASTGFAEAKQDGKYVQNSNAGHSFMIEAGAALCFGPK